MVPCWAWVDIDQKTGRVQDFPDLGIVPYYYLISKILSIRWPSLIITRKKTLKDLLSADLVVFFLNLKLANSYHPPKPHNKMTY